MITKDGLCLLHNCTLLIMRESGRAGYQLDAFFLEGRAQQVFVGGVYGGPGQKVSAVGKRNNWEIDKLEDRYSNIRDEAVKGELYDSHRHFSGRAAVCGKYDVLATGTGGLEKGQHLKTNSGMFVFSVIGTVRSHSLVAV